MSGLQILTLVLFAIVVAVDASSNIPRALPSIGNLYLRQINCTGHTFLHTEGQTGWDRADMGHQYGQWLTVIGLEIGLIFDSVHYWTAALQISIKIVHIVSIEHFSYFLWNSTPIRLLKWHLLSIEKLQYWFDWIKLCIHYLLVNYSTVYKYSFSIFLYWYITEHFTVELIHITLNGQW